MTALLIVDRAGHPSRPQPMRPAPRQCRHSLSARVLSCDRALRRREGDMSGGGERRPSGHDPTSLAKPSPRSEQVSKFPYREGLTAEQAETLDRAAFLVVNARNDAASMLLRSGMEPPPDSGWFGSPCGAEFPPPPSHHPCGCRNYKGDGGPCSTSFTDHTGPDFGTGSPNRTCGHRPSEHLVT